MTSEKKSGHRINQDSLPDKFPTHSHEPVFWENLGRTVATFGFLEEVLSKAIFSFTATTQYEENEILKAYNDWLPKLERTLSDPLGGLIDTYGKSVRDNSMAEIENFDDLLNSLRDASKVRNVLCHGSWRLPDSKGASVPLYVNKQQEIFETAVDIDFLCQVQKHAADIACAVINTVTSMGWQFPGSNGPGKPIWGNS